MFDISKKFRFRNFRVYGEARSFLKELKALARSSFPEQERFGLLAQLGRALDSVVLNIAEGSERGSDRDFARFLSIANASLNEVVACLDLALDGGYLRPSQHQPFLEKAASLGNHLSAFRDSLLRSESQMSNVKSPKITAARSIRQNYRSAR